jgi:hypothetical protein
LLDVAYGKGRHIEHLARTFHAEGIDISRQFLRLAAGRNPGCMFHVEDMTKFKLKQKFDAINRLFSCQHGASPRRQLGYRAGALVRAGETWHPPKANATFMNEPDLKKRGSAQAKPK